MLYAIAHFLRDKIPWLWALVDLLNSFLFNLRYGKKLFSVENGLEMFGVIPEGFKVVPIREVATDKLVEFFAAQPEEAFKFFKPHRFDSKSIRKLQKNSSFLAYVLIDVSEGFNGFQKVSSKNIAGYCFNRSFFHGKGFRGRMVGIDYRGRGLGTLMNKLLNEVGFGIGLRLYETVNKDNVASYRSAVSASNFKVVEELPHNELYLEIINDMKQIGNQNVISKIGGGKPLIISMLYSCNSAFAEERRAA